MSAPSQSALAAAYSLEINNCSFREDAGVRVKSRPQEFCDSVTVKGATTLVGAMTAQGVASFQQPIVVQGITFSPQLYLGVYVLASGPLQAPAPPAPPA